MAEASPFSSGDPAGEPWLSLFVLGNVMSAFCLSYLVFSVVCLVQGIQGHYSQMECWLYVALFTLNLASGVALIIFQVGVKSHKWGLVRLYQGITLFAILGDILVVSYITIFDAHVWSPSLQNLLSTTIALIYKFMFIGASALFYLLVCINIRPNMDNKTEEKANSRFSCTLVEKKGLEQLVKQLDNEIGLFVRSVHKLRTAAEGRDAMEPP